MDSQTNNKTEIFEQITNLIHRNKLYEARELLKSHEKLKTSPEALLLRVDAIQSENTDFVQQLLEKTLKTRESAWVLYKAYDFFKSHKNIKKTRYYKNKLQSTLIQSVRDDCAYGLLFVSLEKYEKAELQFKEALKKDPRNVMPLMRLAQVSAIKKNKKNEEKWLNKVLDICPFHHDALLSSTRIDIQNENFKQALEKIKIIKIECQASPMAIFCEAQCYQHQKQFVRARNIYHSLLGRICPKINIELEIGKNYLAEGLFKKVRITEMKI